MKNKPAIRRIIKKGHVVSTRKGKFVLELSRRIMDDLRSYCKKIKVVGSIRRKEKNPVDIDIVLIPKSQEDKKKIRALLIKKGQIIEDGEQQLSVKVQGVKIELYYTVPEEWGAALLAYSSEFGAGIGLRVVAKKKGFKLNQHGLWKGSRRVAGKTEEEIYRALGRPYKEPWNR